MSALKQVGPDRFIVPSGRDDIQENIEDLIPPGKEPQVFDMNTGLGMKESWSPGRTKDDTV